MFDNVCSIPLSSDLVAQVIHPTNALVTVGLASGHVSAFRLPSTTYLNNGSGAAGSSKKSTSETGYGTIETAWRTKRHKGSCRSLVYSHDGTVLFSAGTDGLVKAADTETGQVVSKIAIPWNGEKQDHPSLIHSLSPESFLLATDSSNLHLYDVRDNSTFTTRSPRQTHRPHWDYISSLTELPHIAQSYEGNNNHFLTTGGTTYSITDFRMGVIVKMATNNDEEELLSSVWVGKLRGKHFQQAGEKIFLGSSTGLLTMWEKATQYDPEEEYVVVDKGMDGNGGESLECLAMVPDELGLVDAEQNKALACGLGDGRIKLMQLGWLKNREMVELRHDDVEPVFGIGFERQGRMITGGGKIVKIWQKTDDDKQEENEVDGHEETGDSVEYGTDGIESTRMDSSSEEEEPKPKRRKKRKRGKGNERPDIRPIVEFKGKF